MLRLKEEVVVINPCERNAKFRNCIGLIIRHDWNLFRESEYKLLFKDLEMQKWNSIGIHSFTKKELKSL